MRERDRMVDFGVSLLCQFRHALQTHPVVLLVRVGVRKAVEDDMEVTCLLALSRCSDTRSALGDVTRESAQNVLIERLVEAVARLAECRTCAVLTSP